jgi:tetratricopeptide (TPR) repeat protein
MPLKGDIRAALLRIVAVHPFKESPQLSSFLKFVVEQTLEGKGDELKGYTIATLALGRTDDFDPQIDPIVRVQAGRVRQAIEEYYAAFPDDPIRIQFVKGSYQPQFVFSNIQNNSGAIAEQSIDENAMLQNSLEAKLLPNRQDRFFGSDPDNQHALSDLKQGRSKTYNLTRQGLLGLVTIAALLGIAFIAAFGALTRTSLTPASVPQQSYFPVLLIENSNGPSDPSELYSVLQRTQDALARFDDILIVRDPADERGSSQLEPPRSKAKRLSLRIIANFADRGRLRFNARLVEQFDQSVVWSKEFEPVLSGTAGDDGRSNIVRTIATTIARPYGVLHAYARKVFTGLEESQSDFGCIMVAFDYWQHNNKELRTQAKKCLEEQLIVNPRLGALHSQLAYLYLDDIIVDNLEEPKRALDHAIAAAIRGGNLAPTSARAYQTLMAVHFVRKEMESAWRAADTALRLNPFDSDISADVGVHYIKAGQFEKGLSLIDESMVLNSSPPDWVLTYRAMALRALGRYDEAVSTIKPLKASELPLAMVGNITAAFQEKDKPTALDRIEIFKQTHPDIFANPRGYVQRMNLERGLTEAIISRYQDALAWAGQAN